jgi:hypothetical protein
VQIEAGHPPENSASASTSFSALSAPKFKTCEPVEL